MAPLLLFLFPFVYLANFISLIFYTAFGTAGKLAYTKYAIAVIVVDGFIHLFYSKALRFYIFQDQFVKLLAWLLIMVIVTLPTQAFDLNNFLQNIQVVMVFFVMYLVGVSIYIRMPNGFIPLIVSIYMAIYWFSVAFGLVEIIVGDYFWSFWHLAEFYREVMGFDDVLAVGRDIPRAWISWDLYAAFNVGVRRFVSFFIEPVGYGRFVGVAVILSYWRYKSGYCSKYNFGLVLCVALSILIMSINKGGILMVAMFFFAIFVGVKMLLLGFAALASILLLALISGQAEILGPSVVNHASSVVQAYNIVSQYPLGLGLNVDDVMLVKQESQLDNDYVEDKSEGGLALFCIFFGIPGFIFYMFFVYSLFLVGRKSGDVFYFSTACLCVMLSGIFAHSAFSIVGSGVLFIIFGWSSIREYFKFEPSLDKKVSYE